MSQWGQDPDRVRKVKELKETDYSRWASLENHNPGWVNRVKVATQFIPDGARVLELGAGLAQMRSHLEGRCEYQPSDIVAHEPDFLVLDLNQDDAKLPTGYSHIVALGVLEYVYDVRRAIRLMAETAPNLLFTYCARIEGSELVARLQQGWLSDLDDNGLENIIHEANLEVERCLPFGGTPAFRQSMFVTRRK